MKHCLLQHIHVIYVAELKVTGGQYKQGLQMKLQQILSDVQNVETHGGHLTNFLNIIRYKVLYYENASKDIKVSCR